MENENTALVVQIEQSNLPEAERSTLFDTFSDLFKQSQEWSKKAKTIVITSVEQVAEMKQAREARLILKDIRVNTEKNRKRLKEDSLRKGQTIDAIAKIITNEIIPTEKYLEDQENFLVNLENERLRKINDQRVLELSQYVDVEFFNLRDMTEEKYQELLLTSKNTAQIKKDEEARLEALRIEAEKKEAEERNRIALENEKLRAEAAEKEKAAQAAQLLADQKLAEERKAKEKLEAEIAAKNAQEERERLAKAQAEQEAQLAPDKEKINVFARSIQALTLPEIKDETLKIKLVEAKKKLDKIAQELLTK